MELQGILQKAAECFGGIPGVKALVLGGSHATDSAMEGSDIDIGLYYDGEIGLDYAALNEAAKSFDDRHQDGLVTETGGWGPWINGGGWLTADQVPVDLLYRDFSQVRAVVEDCLRGDITLDYQSGHPFAFVNTIYMGETACCRPFLEKDADLRTLKERLKPYPETCRRAVYEKFLGEAEFSLLCGQKGVVKKDVTYCAGSLFRAVNSLAQVLYAAQGEYLLNEKGCLRRLRGLSGAKQARIVEELEGLLAGLTPENLGARFARAKQILKAVRGLTEEQT